jgi:hypothetical protein
MGWGEVDCLGRGSENMTSEINNCIDCKHHTILPDPDPDDWFCDDDVKVICDLSDGKQITCACRPYHVRDECSRPEWCKRTNVE